MTKMAGEKKETNFSASCHNDVTVLKLEQNTHAQSFFITYFVFKI